MCHRNCKVPENAAGCQTAASGNAIRLYKREVTTTHLHMVWLVTRVASSGGCDAVICEVEQWTARIPLASFLHACSGCSERDQKILAEKHPAHIHAQAVPSALLFVDLTQTFRGNLPSSRPRIQDDTQHPCFVSHQRRTC